MEPAVENQATDRAHRIARPAPCRSTSSSSADAEEPHDEMIEQKTELAENIIGGGGDRALN